MSELFDAGNDFATVIDALQPLTLVRRNSANTIAASGRCAQQQTEQAEPSAGYATQADATWHVQLATEGQRPRLGDALVDPLGHRWTILQLRELPSLNAWRCTTRELRIAAGCVDRVDIERGVWEAIDGELQLTGWSYVSTAVPVRIQPLQSEIDRTTTPPSRTDRYTILFGGQVTLEPEDRFVGEDGVVYHLERLEQAERIDVLPVATVVKAE